MRVRIKPGAIAFTQYVVRRKILLGTGFGHPQSIRFRSGIIGFDRHSQSNPTIEQMLIILPERCFIMGRTADLVPVKRTFEIDGEHRIPLRIDILMTRLSLVIPALFTNISIRPNFSTVF